MFRAELSRAGTEHQVLFSSMHEKRAEAIIELYQLLVEATWAFEVASSQFMWAGDPPKGAQAVEARNALATLYRHADKNRFLLPASLYDSVENLIVPLRKHAILLQTLWSMEDPTPAALTQRVEALDKARNMMDEIVPPLRAAVEQEVRTLLGVIRRTC